MRPFFSIIIPTFNSASTIAACFNTIASQTLKNYEVIIVDGLSNDETASIVAQYKNRLPQLSWISEKDEGIYDAMNKGIKVAQGEWLYFLGSDDKLHDGNVLAIIYELNKGPAKLVYGNVQIVGKTSWANDGEIYDGEFNLEKILRRNICHQGIFYHQDCFINNTSLFNTEYSLCADWDFNLRCWASVPCLYVNVLVAYFYAGGKSTETNVDTKFSKDIVVNLKQYFKLNYPSEVRRFISDSQLQGSQQSLSRFAKKIIFRVMRMIDINLK